MAPKRKVQEKSKKKARIEDGQSSGGNLQPNWNIHRSNTFLFRDLTAYQNFTGLFMHRNLAECYFFDKATVTFDQPEDDKIIGFVNHWNWNPLLTCTEPYTMLLTRTFYANLTIQDDPFIAKSWLCGQEIDLSLANMAQWLELPNDGEESYPFRNWPLAALGTHGQYKKWFDRNNIGGPIYVSNLPSLHRLLFLLINNILIPKATIKTNLEWGPMYYLRHLISMDDKALNIPYIILRHMGSAFNSRVALLPYAHLIHKIIRLNGLPLPEDEQLYSPIDLVSKLTKTGWVLGHLNSGLRCYKPDDKEVNEWINKEGALPNQYWDPDEQVNPVQQPQHQQPQQPGQFPQWMPQPGQFPKFAHIPPPPQEQDQQMGYLCNLMYSHHIQSQQQYEALQRGQEVLRRGQMRIRKRMLHQSRAIQAIDESQHSLSNRFVAQYGPSSNPVPRSTFIDEDFLREEEELRNIQEDDYFEGMEDENMENMDEENAPNEEEDANDTNQPPNA